MTRVKKGVHALKRRRSVLSQTKGMRPGRSTKERQAKDALRHAGNYAFAHRRDKKSHNRKLRNIKINAGAREIAGMSYSKLVNGLKKKNFAGPALLVVDDGEKLHLAVHCGADALTKGLKAGDWIRETAKVAGGGGGGRPQMAQAGGKDPSKLADALQVARDFAVKTVGV